MKYSTVQYRELQYSEVQCSTVQYSTVKCSIVKYSAGQHSTVENKFVVYSTFVVPAGWQEYTDRVSSSSILDALVTGWLDVC